MPIVAADLKAFGAANHAEDDVATQGGAISTVKRESQSKVSNTSMTSRLATPSSSRRRKMRVA